MDRRTTEQRKVNTLLPSHHASRLIVSICESKNHDQLFDWNQFFVSRLYRQFVWLLPGPMGIASSDAQTLQK